MFFVSSFCFGQSKITSERENHLPSYKAILRSGDYEVETYEIHIYKNGSKYYADNVSPLYFYGKRTDGIWHVELNNKQLGLCETFLKEAKSKHPKCPDEELASGVWELFVIVGTDTRIVTDPCEWKGPNFHSLQKTIFAAKLIEFENKKAEAVNELNRKLKGKWCFDPLKEEPKQDEYIVLTKANNNNCECYIQFEENYICKSSSKKGLNLSSAVEYKLFLNKSILIRVEHAILPDKDGIYHLIGDEARFRLDSISDKVLTVQYTKYMQ